MRVGKNPMKESKLAVKEAYHRVIIPVYIPHLRGYYCQSVEILKICIDTLSRTIHDKTTITIINNNSCCEVKEYLRSLLSDKIIDQLIEYHENKGKIDPVVASMKGCLEPLITISDCDVLFKPGWQNAVELIFRTFKNVGMVSPQPQPALYNYYSSFSWFWNLIDGSLKVSGNPDIESLLRFKFSVGNGSELSDIEKEPIVVEKEGIKAIIGAGHFCATYNRFMVKYIPDRSSGPIFNNAERYFLDKPVEDAMLQRLSTYVSYVNHMGNTLEDWMFKEGIGDLGMIKQSTPQINEFTLKEKRILVLFRPLIRLVFNSSKTKSLRLKLLGKR